MLFYMLILHNIPIYDMMNPYRIPFEVYPGRIRHVYVPKGFRLS